MKVKSSIIRWAGSKKKLLPELQKEYKRSRCNNYAEPFCGSACLFFNISTNKSILSDFNEELIEMYDVVCKFPYKLHSLLSGYPRSPEFYYKTRALNPKSLKKIERAARFMYLNRFCFNGLFRTNLKGNFNVPRGSHTGDIPSLDELLVAREKLVNTLLLSCDFHDAIANVDSSYFVYLDPPYVYKERKERGEYGVGSFDLQDISRLETQLNILNDKGAKFLLSYVDKPEMSNIKSTWVSRDIPVNRQIGGFSSTRRIVRELLITNY